jgi:hypothetical protein
VEYNQLIDSILSSTKPEDKVQCALLLNVVVPNGPAFLELFPCENESLLVGWDALLLVDLCLDALNRFAALNLNSHCPSRQSLYEYLHSPTKPEDKVQCALLLNVVVPNGPAFLELFPCENESLLVGWDALLLVDLCLDALNRFAALNLNSHCPSRQSLYEYLHSPTKPEDKVQCALLLNVVVPNGPAFLELFPCENESLLVGWDALLLVDLCLDALNRFAALNLNSHCPSRQSLYEYLHSPTKPEDKVQCALLLNVVVPNGPAFLELFPCENESLLVGWDALLLVDLCLDALNRFAALNLNSHCPSRQSLYEYLHSPTKPEDKVQCALLLNVVVPNGPAFLELFPCENESLLVGWDALLLVDLCLDALNRFAALNLNSHCPSRQSLYEYLHSPTKPEDKVQCALLLNVVVPNGPAFLELFPCENESLLVGWDALLLVDLCLDALNRFAALNLNSHCPSRQSLYEYLHVSFVF